MTKPDPQRNPSGRVHLDYLDGLRGLAALYVALFHAGPGYCKGDLPFFAKTVVRGLSYGHFSVAVFIVLSGYCLMLPVARADGELRGGTAGYLLRRAWRILPPYYFTIALSLAIMAALPALQSPSGTGTVWDGTAPTTIGALASHLLVIHNLFPKWVHRINGPLWSVATEWQIYFFLPLLLLPLWRRLGPAAPIAAALVLGYLPCLAAPSIAESAATWYLALFAFGMIAAAIGFSSRRAERALAMRVPWRAVAASAWLLCAIAGTLLIQPFFRHIPVADAMIGLATASTLVHYTRCVRELPPESQPWFARFLQSKPVAGLGRFSYSLYLTHMPILAACFVLLRPFHPSAVAVFFFMLGVAIPLSVVIAYLFHLAVERRFLAAPPAPRTIARVSALAAAALAGAASFALALEALLEWRDSRRVAASATYAVVGARRVRYELDPGPPNAPMVVLVPGLAPLEEWTNVQRKIRAFAPTLSYDRCGMGFSDPVADRCTPEMAADELAALLAQKHAKPIVLTTYSVSSFVGRAFARKYRDMLAGLLFVDPTMPDSLQKAGIYAPSHYTFRFYLEALFGSRRWRPHRGLIMSFSHYSTGDSAADARWDAADASARHWRAVSRSCAAAESLAPNGFRDESFGDLPVVVLSTSDPNEPHGELPIATYDAQEELARESRRGVLRRVGGADHTSLVQDDSVNGVVVEAVRDIVRQVTESPRDLARGRSDEAAR